MGAELQSASGMNHPTQDPIWLQAIVNYLRANAHEFNRHERMQLVFDRVGDNVKADYSVKSITLQKP